MTPRAVIDLGATRVKFALSEDGKSLREPTRYRLDRFRTPLDLIETLFEEHPSSREMNWVLGVPSPVENNWVTEVPNLPEGWGERSINNALAEHGLDFILENDANLSALGEFSHGSGQGESHLVCLTLGTGIGGGIIVNGSLYRGRSGAAGEVGHVTLVRGGRPCGCGNRGCFEQYGSASGLSSTYEQLTGEHLDAEIIAKRHSSDPEARKALEATGTHLGRGLAILCNVLEPDCFVLAGGLSNAFDLFEANLREAFEKNVFAKRARRTSIEPSSLEDPALYGGLELPLSSDQV